MPKYQVSIISKNKTTSKIFYSDSDQDAIDQLKKDNHNSFIVLSKYITENNTIFVAEFEGI